MADEASLTPPAPPSLPAKRRRSSLLRSAQDAFLAGAAGTLSPGEDRVAVARAVAGAKAASPHMVLALIDKAMRGENSPVDREAARIVVQLAGPPMGGDASPKERERLQKEIEALSTMSAADLERDIFREAVAIDNRVAPVPEAK